MSERIPIFPLGVVVFPGQDLNLHIFEPRYKQLIQDTAKTKMPFGIPVVLEKTIGNWGTLVELVEIANVEADGRMDIRTRGLRVFRIQQLHATHPGKLYGSADVEYPAENRAGDAMVMRAVVAGVRKLHALLKVRKSFAKPLEELTSGDVAQHAGLSLQQEYEMLVLMDEGERQKYLLRHLEKALPVVAQMELLKEKVRLNGHFKSIPGLDA